MVVPAAGHGVGAMTGAHHGDMEATAINEAVKTFRGAAVLVALAATTPLSAQHAIPAAQWAAFTRDFDVYADSDGIVGASVVFVRGGRVVAHHEHGLADRALGRP